MDKLFARLDLDDFNQVMASLRQYFPLLAQRYQGAAGELAAQYYGGFRRASGFVDGFETIRAVPTVAADLERGLQKKSHLLGEGKPSQYQAALVDLFTREVLKSAALTTIMNAERDPLRVCFARVPTGPHPCAFCAMMATKGFVYKSAEAAGGMGRGFHSHDRCVIVPSWGEIPDLRGFNPKPWDEAYQRAKTAAGSKASSREILAEMRRDAFVRFSDTTWVRTQWTQQNWDKAWYGDTIIKKGKTLLVGGHAPGTGWVNKTEFPISWSQADMITASLDSWLNPQAVKVEGDRRTTRKVVRGVMVEVQSWGEDYGHFRASFPVSGDGVIKNIPAGSGVIADPRPLDLTALDDKEWIRVTS